MQYRVPPDEVLARIGEDLSYSPSTGAIRWTNPCESAGIKAGDLAGYIDCQGYVRISLRVPGHKYAVKLGGHRVAWYLMTGTWARWSIDHRDRNRANNRWSNLRRSTTAIERLNRSLRSDNKTGVRGVSIRPDGRFEVGLMCDYQEYHLGVFATLEQAAEVRYRAERDFYGRLTATADRRCQKRVAAKVPLSTGVAISTGVCPPAL